ncbi:VOC family protein [Nocardioides sp. MAHUQ-72]|uniref:VOC family protein n=1 Tax=unclassified Nocardioides TaxID=2615069 RepID=UPI0036243C78
MARFESYPQGTPCYVELTTPDQAAARAFYTGLFGWELEEVPVDDQGARYLTAALEGDAVAGVAGQGPDQAGRPASWAVYLAVEDVESATARVAAAGGKVLAGPFDVMGLGRTAAVEDPTGARVHLWQARTHVGTVRANEPGTPVWHELMTPDVERATRFYSDVLGVGWETMPADGSDYSCLVVEGRQVAGAMAPPRPGIPPCWSVYFDVESVDDAVAWAQHLGATVLAPAFDLPGVGRMAVLADPQGATFNLMQSQTAA